MTTTIAPAVTTGFGYIRVSDATGREGKDNFHSPDQQREEIERFCERRGITLVSVVEAIDQSSKKGKNFQTPEFQSLLAQVEPGTAIIVWKLDRFGRDLKEGLRMIEEIEQAGGLVLSATESTEADPTGRFTRNMLMAVNAYYQDRIQAGWFSVHDRLHNDGVTHGVIPFGYDRPKVNDYPQPLRPNDDAQWVKLLFELRSQGTPWADISRTLLAKSGYKFSGQRIRTIVRNRVYLGEARRGNRPVVKNAHPALVARSTFESCQEPKRQSSGKQDYLLTGLVFCDACGKRMSVSKASHTPTYKCNGGLSTHFCDTPRQMSQGLLDAHVEEAFLRYMDDALFEAANLRADTIDLERALIEAEDDLREWMRNTAAQRASMTLWQEELDRRAKIVDECSKALREAQASSQKPQYDPASIRSAWPTLSNTEKRTIMAASIQRIVIGPGKRGLKGLQADRVTFEWA